MRIVVKRSNENSKNPFTYKVKSIQDSLIEKLNLHNYEQDSKAYPIQHTLSGFSQLLNAKARQYMTVLVNNLFMRLESWLTKTLFIFTLCSVVTEYY